MGKVRKSPIEEVSVLRWAEKGLRRAEKVCAASW